MKRILSLLVLMLTLSVFSIDLTEAIEKLDALSYKVERVFIEKLKDESVKLRFETVYKWGENKVVFVMSPEKIIWIRKDGQYWLGKDVLLYSPVDLKDLEDIAIEELESSDAKIKSSGEGYTITFKTDKGTFKITLDRDFRPVKIEREIMGIKMELDYKEYYDDVPSIKQVLKGLKLSDELAFPQEIGDILSMLSWFSISFEDGTIVVKGIFDGKLVSISISPKPHERFLKYGQIYINSSDEQILEELGLK